ncbi:MAG: hypothetical protein Q9216_002199 [Gyalolechia sp. 2 TL-2023]
MAVLSLTKVFTLAAPFSSITAGPATPTDTATTASKESSSKKSSSKESSSKKSSSPATTTTFSEIVTPALQSSSDSGPTQAVPTVVPETKSNNGSTIGAAVGGGVGGGIVLGTIALLWLWRRRRSKRNQPKRLKISRPFELPSHDPTFHQNSMLFPAELHPQMTKPFAGPAELEDSKSQRSINPAELEHKSSATTTSTGPKELMTKTANEPAGPFELHSREIDSMMIPPSPVKFDEKRRWPFTRGELVEDTGTTDAGAKDASSAHDGIKETEVGIKRPAFKHRPGSVSGPWHDSF